MHRLNRLKATSRLVLCLLIGGAALGVALCSKVQIVTSILVSWDAFCAALLLFSGLLFFSATADDVRHLAQRQDEGRYAMFIIVVAGACVSLVGILLLMKPSDASLVSREGRHAISLLGVAVSWLVLHTIFTLRYAHLYYTDDGVEDESAQVGGLEFPSGAPAPDYLDFVYFSFIIGMTFQVSDVSISSRQIRRVVLMHSLLSFVFNTIIVALTISALSNLGH